MNLFDVILRLVLSVFLLSSVLLLVSSENLVFYLHLKNLKLLHPFPEHNDAFNHVLTFCTD